MQSLQIFRNAPLSITAEIPPGTKKCCSACFQRITRKISQMSSGNNSPASSNATDAAARGAHGDSGASSAAGAPAAGNTEADGGGKGSSSAAAAAASATAAAGSASWSEEEVEAIKSELRNHGRNWPAVSAKIAHKTAEQCKKFFYDCRKKHGLDKIVQEFKRVSWQCTNAV